MKNNFGKKLVVGSLVVALAVPAATGVAAQASEVSSQENVDVVAGQIVPIRQALQYIGASVDWTNAEQIVRVQYLDRTMDIDVHAGTVTVNDRPVPFKGEIEYHYDVIHVPLELINEALGLQLGWDAAEQKPVIAEDAYEVRATSFISQWRSGNEEEAYSFMSAPLKNVFPMELLQAQWGGFAAYYGGHIGDIISIDHDENSVHHNVHLVFETEQVPAALSVRFDHNGNVNDLYTPIGAQGINEPPVYDNPQSYTEQEVTIGEGNLALSGTLTLPQGEGPFPVVVLVHGSGPHDRDEAVGGVKVFRDLAVGLADQGVAVLRYNKLTYEHPIKSHTVATTMQRETADDALLAVELLRGIDKIDSGHIYIGGHSQGGHMIPKMLELDTSGHIAGGVLLASPAVALQDILLEQQLYVVERLEELGIPVGDTSELDVLARQVEILNDPQYDHTNVPADFFLPPSNFYWFEQRDYVPVEEAKKHNVPLLILQGENDWQVTMNQFEMWKKDFGSSSHVQLKSYPNVNHFLVEYDGLSVGMEYGQPANVLKAIIDDIAEWVKNR
ncbi:alpha/beta fold hydrolase [Bacillus horti]|uniref:Dienelactone hydrolase n=1 Tax=Caldalkalibacillus horti TaxID=77523 RepID=A0ABT9W3G3_9BACI|nr:alpha/beta fold hydrolase [Bacillus horti]MDQ0167783.1 dienelactone hydrolase [Bacillus horti]